MASHIKEVQQDRCVCVCAVIQCFCGRVLCWTCIFNYKRTGKAHVCFIVIVIFVYLCMLVAAVWVRRPSSSTDADLPNLNQKLQIRHVILIGGGLYVDISGGTKLQVWNPSTPFLKAPITSVFISWTTEEPIRFRLVVMKAGSDRCKLPCRRRAAASL